MKALLYPKRQYISTFRDKALTPCSNASNGSVFPDFSLKPEIKAQIKSAFFSTRNFWFSTSIITSFGIYKAFLKQFPYSDNISVTSLWRQLAMESAFSLERASLYEEETYVDRMIRFCFEKISKWKEIGFDFQKKKGCIFVDEAGINTYMIIIQAWSKVGEPINVTVQKQRGANISIVGRIVYFGTINFSKSIL